MKWTSTTRGILIDTESMHPVHLLNAVKKVTRELAEATQQELPELEQRREVLVSEVLTRVMAGTLELPAEVEQLVYGNST